jgi:ornithine carbamoyltransferase
MVALIFEKPSTRTRVSFDVGVRQMGGETMVLSGAEMQLGHGETVADTARVLSRYVDLIMIRTFEESTLAEMAEHATVPVINGLTDRSHPCQIMADVMTYEEHRGSIAGAKVVWSGDGNNTCTSWLHAAGGFGFDLTFTGPDSLDPDGGAVAFARDMGRRVEIDRDPHRAVAGADCIVTDTWVSMHDPVSARERRHNLLRPYQVDTRLMAAAKPGALFMHCLPAHRGEEVTSEVMDGPPRWSSTRPRTGCTPRRPSCAGASRPDGLRRAARLGGRHAITGRMGLAPPGPDDRRARHARAAAQSEPRASCCGVTRRFWTM